MVIKSLSTSVTLVAYAYVPVHVHAWRHDVWYTGTYYRIRSIRRRGYYLFHRLSLCGVYSRAATIRERRLLVPVSCQRGNP